MKVAVEDREGLFKALTVEVEGDTVKNYYDQVCEEIRKNVQIEGFRRGNAPLWLIRAKFRDAIEEEVGKKVSDATLKEAIDKSGLKPVADIFLEEIKLEEKVPKLTYRVVFEIAPEFELKDVEGLEVEVPKVEFNEKLLEDRINALREEHASWEPVEEGTVQEGDLVSIDYEVVEITPEGEGEKVSGETSGIIGQKMFREELEKELIGKKEGDEVKLENVPLYDPQGNEVGRANIRAKIKSIKRKVLPEVGDDFAKELGYENWEEAKKDIEEKLKQEIERTKQMILEDAVADKLVEIHDIEVPQTLLRRELSFLIDQRVRSLQAFGVDPKQIDYRALANELKGIAENNIKLRFILDKYAEEKGIEPTQEDIEKQLEDLSRQMNASKEEVRKYFEERGMFNIVVEDARRNRALKEIISKVKIKEVEPETQKTEEKKEEKPQKTKKTKKASKKSAKKKDQGGET